MKGHTYSKRRPAPIDKNVSGWSEQAVHTIRKYRPFMHQTKNTSAAKINKLSKKLLQILPRNKR